MGRIHATLMKALNKYEWIYYPITRTKATKGFADFGNGAFPSALMEIKLKCGECHAWEEHLRGESPEQALALSRAGMEELVRRHCPEECPFPVRCSEREEAWFGMDPNKDGTFVGGVVQEWSCARPLPIAPISLIPVHPGHRGCPLECPLCLQWEEDTKKLYNPGLQPVMAPWEMLIGGGVGRAAGIRTVVESSWELVRRMFGF